MSRDTDVLVLGGAGVDTVIRVPRLPLPYADSCLIGSGIHTRAGQTGDFVALGPAVLGLRTHHLDRLGDDPEGDPARALHEERGVPLTAVPQPAGTKRAVSLVGPDGRRLSLYDGTRRHEGDRFPEPELRALATASRHAHVTINHPCAHALPLLRECGVTVSTDLHDWDGENPYHEPFAHQADLVFPAPRAPTCHLRGAPPRRCALYGAVAGAHACTVPATRTGTISRDELLTRAADPHPADPAPP